MSFDNKMIIDATRGTIARFVNHSCEPNCEMIKWTVGGEPRMALFAGPRGIMTGEELTYDYNFECVFLSQLHSWMPIANSTSPFSQKNIQQCRCGTESCRGVLGPKPKKPVEDKSFTSAIIAGTKRRFHDIVDSVMVKSEDDQPSPKKRKTHIGNSATMKARNADVESVAARQRAEREAAEHDRQIASRQTRALKRSTSATTPRRGLSKYSRGRLPFVKSTRITTVSFQRKAPRSGALKTAKKPLRTGGVSGHVKSTRHGSRRSQYLGRPTTPTRSLCDLDSATEDENSPNITPASLRSASRLTGLVTSAVAGRSTRTGIVRTCHEPNQIPHSVTTSASKMQQDNATTPTNELHETGSRLKKLNHPTQSRLRSTSGRSVNV